MAEVWAKGATIVYSLLIYACAKLSLTSVVMRSWQQVKGSSFPRSYYKCTSAARSISKLIEQQSSDPERYSITYVSDSSEATELNRRLDGISEISIVEGHTV
jgi:hypothetical protein